MNLSPRKLYGNAYSSMICANTNQLIQYMHRAKSLPDGAAYLYGLADPRTDEIRYIGITPYPVVRYKQHCRGKKHFPVCRWIQKVYRETGSYPYPCLLAIYNNDLIDEVEKIFIKAFRAAGNRLTNVCDGGRGCPMKNRVFSETHKRNLSIARIKSASEMTPEEKSLKASRAAKALWANHREDIIAAQNEGRDKSPNRLNGVRAMRESNLKNDTSAETVEKLTTANRRPEKRRASARGGVVRGERIRAKKMEIYWKRLRTLQDSLRCKA